MMIQNFNN